MKLLCSLALLLLCTPAFAAEKQGSAYDRVMSSGVLKCGYGVWAPNIIKDVNTGALSGIFYDYGEALGAATSLKVEWHEVPWTDFVLELNNGRIDAMCAGIWPTGARARELIFTAPVNYVSIGAYVRADDTRFDNALAKLNNAGVTIATMDVEMSSIIAAADFPLAKTLAIPATGSQPQMLLNVAENKADVTFSDMATAQGFMKTNPGKLRALPGGETLRAFGNTIALGKGEFALKALLDTATLELLQSGAIEKILLKYEEYPGSLLRVAKPYEAAK
jgi:polar amino acid transport system substrate-binding protein